MIIHRGHTHIHARGLDLDQGQDPIQAQGPDHTLVQDHDRTPALGQDHTPAQGLIQDQNPGPGHIHTPSQSHRSAKLQQRMEL